MSASFAVQTALISALRGHTEVQAALGSPARVYDMPPGEVTFPFAILERAEARPWGGGPDEGHEHSLSLHVWSRYGGARECKTILAAMQTALHDQPLTLSGHRLVNLRVTYSDCFRAPDGRTHHGVLRLRAVTEPQ